MSSALIRGRTIDSAAAAMARAKCNARIRELREIVSHNPLNFKAQKELRRMTT